MFQADFIGLNKEIGYLRNKKYDVIEITKCVSFEQSQNTKWRIMNVMRILEKRIVDINKKMKGL
jgi:hypothetical protein